MTPNEIRALYAYIEHSSNRPIGPEYERLRAVIPALLAVAEAAKNPACFWQTIECSSAELQEHITARKRLIAAQTALENL